MTKMIANLEYALKMHKKYPKQRFFVPLADLYKRLGYHDEAIEILKEGLKWHPNYVVARALLAEMLEERGEALQAHIEAERVIRADSDNLLGLRIFLKTSEKLGKEPPVLNAPPSKTKIKKLEKLLSRVQGRPHGI